MNLHQTLLRGSVAVASLFACSIASAETTLCTVITQAMLPYTITAPGIYCINQKMSTNLSSGAAITIAANNVVLDLNANAIGNLAAPATNSAVGVFADSRQNVTVKNGIVRGFGMGVALYELTTPGASSGNAVDGMTSDQSRGTGIAVQGTGSVVRDCRVVATNGLVPNDTTGIFVSGAGAQAINNEVINTNCASGCANLAGIVINNAPGAVAWHNRVVNGTMATATASATAIEVDATSPDAFVDYNFLSGYTTGITFYGTTGKYRSTLTTNVTTPFAGGTAVGTNN